MTHRLSPRAKHFGARVDKPVGPGVLGGPELGYATVKSMLKY